MNLTVEQIALSTAEEEQNYFTGVTGRPSLFGPTLVGDIPMPLGTYRIINGELLRIVPGPVPHLPVSTDRT